MDVTLTAIRREYATPRALWVELMGRAATVLAMFEIGRVLWHGGYHVGAAGVGIILLAVGWLLSRFVAEAVRRASFEADLWRKFALDFGLLKACSDLPDLPPEQTELIDQTLGRLRSLAAVRNNDAWDRDDTPDPGDVVPTAERALTRAVAAEPLDELRLQRTADAISGAMDGQRRALSAILHERQDDLAAAWAEFEVAKGKLQELAGSET